MAGLYTILLQEMIVVAVLTAMLGWIVTLLFRYFKGAKWLDIPDMSDWWTIILSYGITGMFIHIIGELSGTNARYCQLGRACLVAKGL